MSQTEMTSMTGRHMDGSRCSNPPAPSTSSTRDALCEDGRIFIAEPEVDVPEYYYIDGGNAYWLFGDILQAAPVDADGHPVWEDGGDVDYDRIDMELVLYGRTIEGLLRQLEEATLAMRGIKLA